MIITDSQVHLWEAHRPDRPWPEDEADKPVFVATPGARPHREAPLGAEEFLQVMDGAGVQRAIIVPPSPVGDNNLTALEAAARYPARYAVMGRFDFSAPDARDRLETWLEQPHMLGIRLTFHKPKWRALLEDDALGWFWQRCEALGIPIMMLTPGRLDQVERLAQRHPGLAIILDHMARRSEQRDDECFADLDRMLALARYDNVSVKASAAPCYSTQPYPFANLEPYLRRIYESFGPMRMFWGSDYSRLPCSYAECLDHFRLTLDFIAAADLEWVLGKALSRLLKWPEAPAPG
jgi:L-fuconolactonase